MKTDEAAQQLAGIVRREVEAYAEGTTFNGITYPISDVSRQSFSVLIVPEQPGKYAASVVVAARIVNHKVVIDADITDRPLWQELVRAGIPRQHIVLGYIGEVLDEVEGVQA